MIFLTFRSTSLFRISSMADRLSRERRSENMRRIRSKGTVPELMVRRIVHAAGFRFRLHAPNLPGRPDLVFPRLHKVVFVHGCFWHQHKRCREGRIPGSRRDYWEPKLTRNVERDKAHKAALHRLGWEVMTVWECQLKNSEKIERKILNFLGR